jgi:hypothetical protein
VGAWPHSQSLPSVACWVSCSLICSYLLEMKSATEHSLSGHNCQCREARHVGSASFGSRLESHMHTASSGIGAGSGHSPRERPVTPHWEA